MRARIDRHTGLPLTGWMHCLQSIGTIVSTALGSLVMARDFGSGVPGLVDKPGSNRVLIDFYMACATALKKEEPCFRLTALRLVKMDGTGRATMGLEGDYFPNGLDGDFRARQAISGGVDVSASLLSRLAGRPN